MVSNRQHLFFYLFIHLHVPAMYIKILMINNKYVQTQEWQ